MGFLYGGVASQSMGIKAHLIGWQATPALRNALVVIPGRPGVADFGGDAMEKVLTVRCNIFPQKDFSALVRVLDSMAEWLDPARGAKQLVLDDVPDRYFTARLSEAVDCERLLRSAGGFDLRFLCPDPHAYALEDETFVLSAEGTHEIRRTKGNTASEPVYLLKAAIGSGGYVALTTNQQELRVVGDLAEGETLVIDAGALTAKVTDVQGETLRNGLPCLQRLHFPVLEKGMNSLTISTADASFFELNIQARSRWR